MSKHSADHARWGEYNGVKLEFRIFFPLWEKIRDIAHKFILSEARP